MGTIDEIPIDETWPALTRATRELGAAPLSIRSTNGRTERNSARFLIHDDNNNEITFN